MRAVIASRPRGREVGPGLLLYHPGEPCPDEAPTSSVCFCSRLRVSVYGELEQMTSRPQHRRNCSRLPRFVFERASPPQSAAVQCLECHWPAIRPEDHLNRVPERSREAANKLEDRRREAPQGMWETGVFVASKLRPMRWMPLSRTRGFPSFSGCIM